MRVPLLRSAARFFASSAAPAAPCSPFLRGAARFFTSSAAPAAPRSRAPAAAALAALLAASGASLLYLRVRDAAALRDAQARPLLAGNPLVYLDVVDGDTPVGRLVIQLRADAVPRAAENFRALCVGALGWGYKGSPFHAAEKGRRVLGGDPFGAGRSGASIYGDTFEDENFSVPHDGPGVVGMRSTGPHTNHSQFYVTLRELRELDGRCVAVGNVVEGWDVLWAMDRAAQLSGGGFQGGRDFRVGACGELKGERGGSGKGQPPGGATGKP
jgi:peptidylprolyl isomerase